MLTRWECWFPLNREIDLFVGNGVLLYKLLIRMPRMEVRCPLLRPEAVCVAIQVFSLATGAPAMLVEAD